MVPVYWGLAAGAAATGCWILGITVLIRAFQRKPRSMKQVAGDNSTQIQAGGDLRQ
jgi:hypothetical protein